MDNKDQNNNSIGDDLNLSHENQKPPIWEHISEALDGDSMPKEEAADAASFSVLKEGFEASFVAKEPPKFMWDKIEQDLESFTTTDAPSDFSAIKTGFEQNYKKIPAPNFMWADLAEKMGDSEPTESVEDYAFVKQSFEKKYSAVVVPLFSWADLAQRIDEEAILADTPDKFSIIKESFQYQYATHKLAANTWAALDQKLNAGSHWKKVLFLLFVPTLWKQAGLFTAIGLLIVGGHFCWTDNSLSRNPNLHERAATAIIASNQGAENTATFEAVQTPSLKNRTARSYMIEGEEGQNTATKADQMNAALLLLKQEERGRVSTKRRAAENKSISKKASNALGSLPDKKEVIKDYNNNNNNNNLPPFLIDENKAANSSNNTVLALEKIDEENKVATAKQALLDEEEQLRSNLKLFANGSNPSWIEQDIMDVELSKDGLSILVQKYIVDEEISEMEEEYFTLVRQMQKGKKIRFEIGLIGRGCSSILLGQNTYNAWNDNGGRMKMCPRGALGLLSNYYFSLKDAVVVGIYPYVKMEQGFGVYNNDGNYENKKLSLALFELSLGYQRTLIRYNNLGQIPSKIYARLDLGLGILTNAKTAVNDVLVNTANLYNTFNVSAGLALGNTHEFKQFVLDYGITGNVGLNQIVTSANPNILESARLLNFGAFLGLRYLISPRLEPSKKQRQFDWSPPFYIEEPTF